MIAPAYYPSTWTVIGSSAVYMLIMLPFLLTPYLVLRRLIKGAW